VRVILNQTQCNENLEYIHVEYNETVVYIHVEYNETLVYIHVEANKILFYSTSSINSVMNLHEYNILFITYPKLRLFQVQKNHISLMRQHTV
jgi:hypothetical protein